MARRGWHRQRARHARAARRGKRLSNDFDYEHGGYPHKITGRRYDAKRNRFVGKRRIKTVYLSRPRRG